MLSVNPPSLQSLAAALPVAVREVMRAALSAQDVFNRALATAIGACPATYYASAALSFGTVAQDATAVQAVTVKGAPTTAKLVSVSPTAQLPAGVSCYGWVSSSGVVSVAVANSAGSQAVTAAFNVKVEV